MKPIICYVGGPYRDPRGHYYVEQNIRRAEAVAAELWQHGYAALAPHLNTRAFDGLASDEWFLEGDLLMLARCDVMVLTADWARSAGTRAEVAFAEEHGIPWIESAHALLWETLDALAALAHAKTQP